MMGLLAGPLRSRTSRCKPLAGLPWKKIHFIVLSQQWRHIYLLNDVTFILTYSHVVQVILLMFYPYLCTCSLFNNLFNYVTSFKGNHLRFTTTNKSPVVADTLLEFLFVNWLHNLHFSGKVKKRFFNMIDKYHKLHLFRN